MQTLSSAIAQLPSPAGNDDYAVHICTNEMDQTSTLMQLRTAPVCGNTILGVSGMFLLNVTAIRGCADRPIENVVVLDRSQRVEHFWKEMQPIVAQSQTRHEVIAKIKALMQREGERYLSGGKLPWNRLVEIENDLLFWEIACGDSWLASDESFAKIQALFQRNCFIFKRLDLADREAIHSLCEIFRERKITLDTLYISNVLELLSAEEICPYVENLEELTAPETYVIHTSRTVFETRPNGQTWRIAQLVSQKKEQDIAKLLEFAPIVKDEHLANGDPAPGSIRLNLMSYASMTGTLPKFKPLANTPSS